MRAYERLLKYVKINTVSDENSTSCPSTASQMEFGKILKKEMIELGIENVRIDNNGYVYGEISASKGFENSPQIGLISHMDTAPAFNSENIKPSIIENYDGNDIVLNKEKNIIMEVSRFSHLKNYIGQSLMVTDGNTLLGSDDKAGISEILTAAEEIINEKSVHGKIVICFTPDEEIGRGADLFDIKGFGAKYAYTVDGGELGELEYENFNAAGATIKINGENIHPGEAKNKMINASLLAMEFNSMLPHNERPEHTEKYEGFYHLTGIKGNEEEAVISYIIRDHDKIKFEEKKNNFLRVGEYLNKKYGNRFIIEIEDSYYNMKKIIEEDMSIVEKAKKAMEENDVVPIIKPIRGGTDGARLSYMGLPCPNISTGGHNFHGKYEYIPVESMDKMVKVIKSLVTK